MISHWRPVVCTLIVPYPVRPAHLDIIHESNRITVFRIFDCKHAESVRKVISTLLEGSLGLFKQRDAELYPFRMFFRRTDILFACTKHKQCQRYENIFPEFHHIAILSVLISIIGSPYSIRLGMTLIL